MSGGTCTILALYGGLLNSPKGERDIVKQLERWLALRFGIFDLEDLDRFSKFSMSNIFQTPVMDIPLPQCRLHFLGSNFLSLSVSLTPCQGINRGEFSPTCTKRL